VSRDEYPVKHAENCLYHCSLQDLILPRMKNPAGAGGAGLQGSGPANPGGRPSRRSAAYAVAGVLPM
jgi:hypothetical protein